MRFHGGSWKGVRIDFSINVNPLAPKELINELILEAVSKGTYLRYPDYRYSELREAIGGFYGTKSEYIIPTNGAAEALSLIVLALRPKYVALTCPSFGDYEIMCNALRTAINYVPYRVVYDEYVLDVEALTRYCRSNSLIIINNPNNPTGSVVNRGEIFELLGWRRCYVLIDEAYAELCSDYEVKLPKDLPTNIVIVRSFTKWLSIPGIRAGFIYVVDNELRDQLDSVRQPWNVNSIAEYVITKLLTKYSSKLLNVVKESRNYLSKEREWLSSKLRSLGFKVFKSRVNFVLIKHDKLNLSLVNELLIKRYGIAIRPCIGFRGLSKSYARVSIRCRSENEVLIKSLNNVMELMGVD